MKDERRAISLTLDQAVTLTHHITNVRSNPTALADGCCLDSCKQPAAVLKCMEELHAELATVLTFDDQGPRWLRAGETPEAA